MLQLNHERHVTNVSCTCVSEAGGKCKHIYALIHYINTDRSASKTTLEQEWGKPSDLQISKDIYAKPIVVTDMFKAKSSVRCDTPYDLQYSDVMDFPCALRNVLWQQNVKESVIVVKSTIEDIITSVVQCSTGRQCQACAVNLINFSNDSFLYSQRFEIANDEHRDFYYKNVHLSEKNIVDLCIATLNQSSCDEWFKARQCRISASAKAHQIKVRRKKSCLDLAKDFLKHSTTNQVVKSLEYGRKNENRAILAYEEAYSVQVQKIGLFVMPLQPWLCASADGLIIENGCITKLLEIKCPSSCAAKPVFDVQEQKINVPYLYLRSDVLELKENNVYYTQCQMLMYVTGLTTCDLYVWSSKGSCLVEVHRDEDFLKNILPILKDFYFTHYLKALYDEHKENFSK